MTCAFGDSVAAPTPTPTFAPRPSEDVPDGVGASLVGANAVVFGALGGIFLRRRHRASGPS